MARSRRFVSASPVRTTSKRQTVWDFGPSDVGQTLSGTGAAVWVTGIQLASSQQKVTLVRTRGVVSLQLGSGAAIFDGFQGAVGIGIVSLPAFTAGIASMPTPRSDVGWPGWLWHSFFDLRTLSATFSDGVNGGPAAAVRLEVDSKAMRKFAEDQVIFGAIEVVEQGTSTMRILAETRLLYKLS